MLIEIKCEAVTEAQILDSIYRMTIKLQSHFCDENRKILPYVEPDVDSIFMGITSEYFQNI